jgi:cytochrome c556
MRMAQKPGEPATVYAALEFGGAMAKGEIPYDADIARAAAANLHAALSMKNPTMWPKGSGNDALGRTTRAKPEI